MSVRWRNERLQDVCQIKPPKKEARQRLSDPDLVSFVSMSDLGICMKDLSSREERLLSEVSGSYTYFAERDVLLAKITPCFENGKLGIGRDLKNGIGFGSSEALAELKQSLLKKAFAGELRAEVFSLKAEAIA